MIRMTGISRRYNGVEALKGIDLEIRKGEWMGLVGPNGSGKTTLIRIILGLTAPTTGRVSLNGESPSRESWLSFKKLLGFMPERIHFYGNLTGEETLRYFASIRGNSGSRIPNLLEQVGLGNAGRRRVNGYSKGMRQRLNLAQALLTDPEVLILDEPTEGLDPHAVREFFRLLRGTGERGKTVLLSSHRLGELENQVDRVCILGEGKICALGTPRELMGKLELAVNIHVLVGRNGSEPDPSTLEALGFQALRGNERHYSVNIPYPEKAGFLERLYAMGIRLDDIWIDEPDLEEVYFETY